MRKLALVSLILLLSVFSCSKKAEQVKLSEGMPAYELGKAISATLPDLDPDKNMVLVSSKQFNVTTGEVLLLIQTNFSSRVGQVKSMDAEQLKGVFNNLAKSLGEQKLLLSAAGKAGIMAAETEVDSIINLQYERYGGEEKYAEWLERNGMLMATVREDIRKNITISDFLDNALEKNVAVTEEDILAVYDQDKTASVRHILLLTQGKSDSAKQEIRTKMEEILAKAKAGEDFAELAKEYTEDPGSKSNGGLYENFEKGRMVKPFEDAAFSIPIGELSDVVETQYGFHILKVIDRQKETRPLEEVREEITSVLERDKRNEAYNNFMENLKSEMKYKEIEI